MTASALLLLASCCIVGTLGAVHLLYACRGNRFDPRDPDLRAAMERSSLVITRQTTVWRASRGLHASHSLGLMVWALVYGHLALTRTGVLSGSHFLMALGLSVLLAYLGLAHRYFFSIPFRGIALACVLYGLGWGLM